MHGSVGQRRRWRRWRSNPSGKSSQERLTRGTECGTMRSMCGAGAGCSAINYQSLGSSPGHLGSSTIIRGFPIVKTASNSKHAPVRCILFFTMVGTPIIDNFRINLDHGPPYGWTTLRDVWVVCTLRCRRERKMERRGSIILYFVTPQSIGARALQPVPSIAGGCIAVGCIVFAGGCIAGGCIVIHVSSKRAVFMFTRFIFPSSIKFLLEFSGATLKSSYIPTHVFQTDV